jgi:hypothetical protein
VAAVDDGLPTQMEMRRRLDAPGSSVDQDVLIDAARRGIGSGRLDVAGWFNRRSESNRAAVK